MTVFLAYVVLILSFLLWRQYRAWQKAEREIDRLIAACVASDADLDRSQRALAEAHVVRRLLAENISQLMADNAKLIRDVETLTTYILASQKAGKWVTAYPGLAELRIGRTH